MNTAGKVAIGLLVVGVVGGVVLLSSTEAHAAPKPKPTPPPPPGPTPPTVGPAVAPSAQPQDHDPTGGVVVVPPAPSAPPGVVPPPPGPAPSVAPDGSLTVPLPGGGSATVPPGSLPSVTTGPGGGSVLNIPGGGQVPLPPIPGVTPPAAAPGAQPPSATPALPPGVPGGGQTIPVTVTASAPTPADTIAVVTGMLANEAKGTQWRSLPSPGLAEWQHSRGLTADGMFGTGTALAMAKEIGTLPIIRAWPRTSYLEGHWLPDYRASLVQLANSVPEPQRSELLASSVREQGQGFGTPPKPITDLITLDNA